MNRDRKENGHAKGVAVFGSSGTKQQEEQLHGARGVARVSVHLRLLRIEGPDGARLPDETRACTRVSCHRAPRGASGEAERKREEVGAYREGWCREESPDQARDAPDSLTRRDLGSSNSWTVHGQ
jgi:hypothetical protein